MKFETIGRREVLKLGAGAAGAIATPKILESLDSIADQLDGSTSQQARNEIARFRTSFDNDRALMREASASAIDRWYLPESIERDRHGYLFDYFSNTSARFMPAGVKNRITPLMPGLAAQESRFHPDRVSPAGAVTILQFLPSTYRGLGGDLSIDELQADFAEQVEFAFKHLDEGVYKVLDDGVNFDQLCNNYGVSGREKNEFIALCVINAYKAGQTRMVRVLNGFQSGFLVDSLPPGFDQTGLGLFHVMSNFMSGYGRSIEPGYGPQSHEYPLKVIAGAESLADEFGQPYGLKVDRANLVTKGVGAAVGVVIADGLLDPRQKRKSVKRIPKDLALSTIKSPLTVAQLVGRSVASVLQPKTTLKRLMTSDKVKDRPAKKRVNKVTRKSPLITRRRVLTTLGAGGLAGGIAAVKDPVSDWLSDVLDRGPDGLDDKLTVAEVGTQLRRLNDRGIFLSSSWENRTGQEENGEVDACGRTTLAGLREVVLDTVVQLLEDLDLLDNGASHENDQEAIVFTGGAEGCGHSDRTHGHGNGYAIDLRRSSSDRVEQALIDQTTVTNRFTRQLYPEHNLVQSGLVVGDKIFRFNSKYFLFGVQNQGHTFVCYFDAESSHRHIEMIPWGDYDVESQDQFAREAGLPRTMRGIWRESVRDYIRSNL